MGAATTTPTDPDSLRYWVQDNVDHTSAAKLDEIFIDLDSADNDLSAQMGRVGEQLSAVSRVVVRLLAHARPADARPLVADSLHTLQRSR